MHGKQVEHLIRMFYIDNSYFIIELAAAVCFVNMIFRQNFSFLMLRINQERHQVVLQWNPKFRQYLLSPHFGRWTQFSDKFGHPSRNLSAFSTAAGSKRSERLMKCFSLYFAYPVLGLANRGLINRTPERSKVENAI